MSDSLKTDALSAFADRGKDREASLCFIVSSLAVCPVLVSASVLNTAGSATLTGFLLVSQCSHCLFSCWSVSYLTIVEELPASI